MDASQLQIACRERDAISTVLAEVIGDRRAQELRRL